MRIGIVLEENKTSGGAYYQCISNCKLAISELSPAHSVILICMSDDALAIAQQLQSVASCEIVKLHVGRRTSFFLDLRHQLSSLVTRFAGPREWLLNSFMERSIKRLKVELLYFLSPSIWSLYISRTPYVFTVWDLCHKGYFEFQEAGSKGEWLLREKLFHTVLPRAVCVMTNSASIGEEIVRSYGIDSERITILPLSPQERPLEPARLISSPSLKVKSEYLIYPARFWPHKNHIYILEALALLKVKDGLELNMIFVGEAGGSADNLGSIKNAIDTLGINDQISFLSNLHWEELEAYIRSSLALVMPSYFGPTNLPILEGFQSEVPVIYSDLPGFRDEYGDSCLYADLMNPNSLRELILRLRKDIILRNQLIQRGKVYLENLDRQRSQGAFANIAERYARISRSWKGVSS